MLFGRTYIFSSDWLTSPKLPLVVFQYGRLRIFTLDQAGRWEWRVQGVGLDRGMVLVGLKLPLGSEEQNIS